MNAQFRYLYYTIYIYIYIQYSEIIRNFTAGYNIGMSSFVSVQLLYHAIRCEYKKKRNSSLLFLEALHQAAHKIFVETLIILLL